MKWDQVKNKVQKLQIGPGSLTRSILTAGAKTVIAVEKDKRFFQALESLRQSSNNRLHTILGDMTTVNEVFCCHNWFVFTF